MAETLVHRGPDEDGYLADGPVAFGFRRLSIIDLQTGQQPVSNEDGSIWCMLNGEIYAYAELRDALIAQGHVFRTHSDTEVIVHAYEQYGLDFVRHLRGMFAVAVWDRDANRVVLARDRVGKKPLFYARRGNELAFASELKALFQWPALAPTLCPAAVHDFLSFLYIPSPRSILQDVHKLPPGHLLVADVLRDSIEIQPYWTPEPRPDRTVPYPAYREELQEVMEDAVRVRLRSDVPLGALLSGGIDSSVVVGLASRHVDRLRTFSIGFQDPRFDESQYARLAAERFNTLHTEEIVDADTLTPEELERLVWFMDEPFGDSSFIPTYWVCRVARKAVTVALSGDGGDELFAGYTRYRHMELLRRLANLPAPLARAGAGAFDGLRKGLQALPATMADRLRQMDKALALSRQPESDRIFSLLTYFDEPGKSELYSPEWRERVNGHTSASTFERGYSQGELEPLVRLMLRDFQVSLVDDALVKVDRASMACSLEVRCPFLDQRVVEFAMRVPPEHKLKGRTQKFIVKDAFSGLLPREVIEHRKQGFEVPFAQWFQREPWRSFLIDVLSEAEIRRRGLFDPAAVIKLRDLFLRDPEARTAPISAYQLRHRVWALFVLHLWCRQFLG
jgi:asparagine synthase (glutamine-hydrolysing)